MTVPDELLEAVAKAAEKSGVSRNRWVRQTLEAALFDTASSEPERAARGTAEAASPRTPEMTPEEKDRAYRERRMRR